ncbi:MAG: F0F1 ATP synthase subunit epsilon [Actinomycetia bacterium]|nr:F0F1 ATP synthase subunit epsilon [Actinomycetes bacterium]
MATMHVELVSVERPLWSGEAVAVYARTPDGEIGVLPRHAPLLAALAPGWTVRIQPEGAAQLTFAVHGGFLSVREDGVSVLAEMAEAAADIDADRARRALAELGDETTDEAVAARERAWARLRAVGETV